MDADSGRVLYGKEEETVLLERQNSKMEIIVTFLLVLEMMKIGKIMISQEDLFGDIQITVKEEPVIT